MNRDYEKSSLQLMVFTMIANFMNYLFQISAARVVSVEDFGTLNVLISTIFVLQVPGQACQLLAAKNISVINTDKNSSELHKTILGLLRISILMCTLCLTVGVILSPIFNQWMRIDNIVYTLIMLVVAGLGLGQFLVMGITQGLQRFVAMSMVKLTHAVVRVFGVFLAWLFIVYSGDRMTLIMSSMIVSTSLSILVGIYALKNSNISSDTISFKEIFTSFVLPYKEFGIVFILNLCVILIMYMDIFLVRMNVSDYWSGLYSGAVQIARIMIFASLILISTFLPMVSRVKAKGDSTIGLYFKVLIYICIFFGVGLAPILMFPEFIIRIFVGDRYIASAVYLQYTYFIAFGVVLIMLNMNYLIALEKTLFALGSYALGVVACLIIGVLIQMTIPQIALMIFIVSLGIYFINLGYLLYSQTKIFSRQT